METKKTEDSPKELDNLLTKNDSNQSKTMEKQHSCAEDEQSKETKTKKCCVTLHMFIANYCILLLFYMTQNIYNIGVIRTIERRFGLRSAQSGLIMSMNDISHIMVVIFVGYFGKRAHKPRVLSMSLLLVALAALLMASPYMIFKDDRIPIKSNSDNAISGGRYSNETKIPHSDLALCSEGETDKCGAEEIQRDSTNKAAYGILLAAQFLAGLGGSSITTYGFAYIDENSEKHKAPLYIGIVTALFAIGPTAGFGLASICLRLPEVLGSDPGGSPNDPSWIGCWWLGYIISACCITLGIIPMWFFPKHIIKPKKTVVENKLDTEDDTVKGQLKAFPKTFLILLKNAPYMVYVVMSVLVMYVVSGLFSNLPRYLETHFLQPAYKSSFVAVSGALSGLIGGFLGGYIMKRKRWGPRGAAMLMIISGVAFMIGILINMNLACPELPIAGEWNNKGEISIDTPCNQNCSCSGVREAYKPVCGEDGLTYFSPCHAGCHEQINGTYHDCRCVPSHAANNTTGGAQFGSARPGLCLEGCNLLLPYTAVFFVASLISSLSRSPATILVFRIIGDEHRAFALGISSFAQNLLAFIPAPVLFGAMIDSTCVLWQKTCSKSGTSNCLWYDSPSFRLITHGSALLFQVLVLGCSIALYVLVRKMKFSQDVKDEDTKENPEKLSLKDEKSPI